MKKRITPAIKKDICRAIKKSKKTTFTLIALFILVGYSSQLISSSLPHDNPELCFANRLLFLGIETNSKSDIQHALMQAGADINAYDPASDQLPLERAVDKRLYGATRYLLKHGANPTAKPDSLSSNYSKLIHRKRASFIQLFLRSHVPYTSAMPHQALKTVKAKDLKSLIDLGSYKTLAVFFKNQFFTKDDLTPAQMAYAMREESHAETKTFFKHLSSCESSCSICYEKLAPFARFTKITSCCHWFHRSCLQKWTAQHPTCPNCRTKIL